MLKVPLFYTVTSSVSLEADPITALLNRDYAAMGGWSLFVMLGMYIIFGVLREWIVPGSRYRRMEESALKLAQANDELMKQNGQLITSNEIVKHFFQETTPKRAEVRSWEPSDAANASG